MRTKRIFLLSVILAGVIALGGCCSVCKQRTKSAKPLEGTLWHLIQIEGKDVNLPLGTFEIRFNEGRMSGIGACNSLMANYKVLPQLGIDINDIASTRMMCPDIERESRMVAVLEGATHYDIDYNILVVIQEGTIKALFKATEP